MNACTCSAEHLNSETNLPPVNCPLMIAVGDYLLPAVRPSFVERRGNALVYLVEGREVSGQFRWTYP